MVVVPAVWLPAQQSDSPKTFLASIYRHYQHGGRGIDITGRSASRFFSASLLALVQADAKAAGAENVGALDADPLCACQDWEGIWNLQIDVNELTRGQTPEPAPRHAEVEVSFSLSPPRKHSKDAFRKLAIKLVFERGGWKIDHIADRTNPKNLFALRKALTDDIELNRRTPQAAR